MATENEEKLCKAIRKYSVLFDKQDRLFNDKNKEMFQTKLI